MTSTRSVTAARSDNDAVVWAVLKSGYGDRAPTLRQTRKLLWAGGVLLGGTEAEAGYGVSAVAAVERNGDYLEILRLAVKGDNQRQGWGRLLVERLCTGPLPLLSFVREDNAAGIGLARATGFRAVAVERGQFGEVDGIRMERWP